MSIRPDDDECDDRSFVARAIARSGFVFFASIKSPPAKLLGLDGRMRPIEKHVTFVRKELKRTAVALLAAVEDGSFTADCRVAVDALDAMMALARLEREQKRRREEG